MSKNKNCPNKLRFAFTNKYLMCASIFFLGSFSAQRVKVSERRRHSNKSFMRGTEKVFS